MNIVHLESVLFVLHKAKEANEELELIVLKGNQILNFKRQKILLSYAFYEIILRPQDFQPNQHS